jgi:hypothetical protein
MFAVTESQPKLSRRQLTRTETGDIPLRPFGAIRDEVYQTYWEVTG